MLEAALFVSSTMIFYVGLPTSRQQLPGAAAVWGWLRLATLAACVFRKRILRWAEETGLPKFPSLPFSFLCWATIGWEQGPHCNFNLQSSYWLKEGMPRAEGLAARQGGQAVPLLYSTIAAQIVWGGAKVHSEVQVKMLVLAMMQCRTVLWDWCHPV